MPRERVPQSVALRVSFEAYLASDHVTPATSKTIAITISKNGAGFGNPSGGATNATEVGGAGNGVGSYYVDLSTTDTGTAGPLIVKGTEGTIDNVKVHFLVVDAHNGGFDGVPSAVAGASSGLVINGVNTGPLSISGGVTFSNSGGDAFTCSSSGGNGTGLVLTGQGTGNGLKATAGATNVDGIKATGGGSGAGISATGGASGMGMDIVGHSVTAGLSITNSAGAGAFISATGANGDGLDIFGNGSGSGLSVAGGATGGGVLIIGNTNAAGLSVLGGQGGDGFGVSINGGGSGGGLAVFGGNTGDGAIVSGGAASGNGLTVTGTGGGLDLNARTTNALQVDVFTWLGVTPNPLILGRVDADTEALGLGVINNVSFATDAVDANALAASATAEIADKILGRSLAGGSDVGVGLNARSVSNALRFLRNKWSIAADVLTVTEEDDLTTAWTSTLTEAAGANPFSASDPA